MRLLVVEDEPDLARTIGRAFKDENFAVEGVKSVMGKVEPIYKKLGAIERLKAVYPDCGHDWQEKERTAAYEFLDRWLK